MGVEAMTDAVKRYWMEGIRFFERPPNRPFIAREGKSFAPTEVVLAADHDAAIAALQQQLDGEREINIRLTDDKARLMGQLAQAQANRDQWCDAQSKRIDELTHRAEHAEAELEQAIDVGTKLCFEQVAKAITDGGRFGLTEPIESDPRFIINGALDRLEKAEASVREREAQVKEMAEHYRSAGHYERAAALFHMLEEWSHD